MTPCLQSLATRQRTNPESLTVIPTAYPSELLDPSLDSPSGCQRLPKVTEVGVMIRTPIFFGGLEDFEGRLGNGPYGASYGLLGRLRGDPNWAYIRVCCSLERPRLLEGRFNRGPLSPRFSPHGSDTLEAWYLRTQICIRVL